ncbi:MAG: PD-(D/E)XK nuclease family protein [Bacteroidales bacterium]|nr:PD-(D/E)XK nuclease family protein [Bacteroidales bacterium]
MKRFLEQIASRFYQEAGNALGEYCFVFPNRRSALFFSKYLGQAADKPVFSPKLLTINDLMTDLSGLRPIDKIGALYTLYRNYAALMWPGEAPRESFDEFVYWGDILLADFDDVDKYRVDARLLFANIRDLKQLDSGYDFLTDEQAAAIREFWRDFLTDSGQPRPGSLDKKGLFRSVWTILFDLYTAFRENLQAQGLGYEGMIYRRVAETLSGESPEKEALVARLGSYRKIVFVGLNALNACEKALLDTIRERLEGDFYWDFEDPRTTDPANKASLFLRENVARYPSKYELALSLPEAQQFRTIAVASGVAQTRVAGDLLKTLAAGAGFDPLETAVVLPDERLLLPMLGAVPEEITDINVTMGFPLSQSNAATFITFLERLHRNKRLGAAGCSFYHKDVVNLLNHPFIAMDPAVQETLSEILKQNLIYVEDRFLTGRGSNLFGLIFKNITDASKLAGYQTAILDAIPEGLSKVDLEFVYHLRAAIQRMQSLPVEMEEKTYYALLGQLIGVISIPFRGEPLSGLQIMGPLETRALDFKNVIILSMNEGTFPKRTVSGSFIPYNLRLGFGLPNYEFQDALSSYYFYRSIARAEHITFIYDARTEGLQSGEPSRFIKQLKYHYNVDPGETTAPMPLRNDGPGGAEIVIPKTPEVMAALRARYLEPDPVTGRRKGFSTSALNQYLDCAVRFYYGHVAGVEETEEVVEELDASLFGSIFHKVMERLYAPYVGQELQSGELERMANDTQKIDRLIVEAFASEGKIRTITGRNLILRQLLQTFVVEVLRCDASAAPLTVSGTEVGASAQLKLASGEEVSLYGIIDRKDLRSGQLHILDYKTGKTGDKVKRKLKTADLPALFKREGEKRPTISFQLLFYTLLVTAGTPGLRVEDVKLDIYALRDIFGSAAESFGFDTSTLAQFRELLQELIGEILNPAVPFRAVNPRCDYCDYKLLCGK